MIFSQEFAKVIEHLPETIMKNAVFKEAYKKRKETKMSKKEFFSELVNELEKEFNYDSNRVKEIVGEKYYINACTFYVELIEGTANDVEEPIPPKLSGTEFEEYFGFSFGEIPLPTPEKYKQDFFEYGYIYGVFLRCVRKIYENFFNDVEKTIKYISGERHNIYAGMHYDVHLEYNILKKLERNIVINGAIGVDPTLYFTLMRETRWILEKNIDTDNYNICMDLERENGENIYLIKANETGCFDASTGMRLTLEQKSKTETKYWEREVKDNKNKLTSYINQAYQAKIALNEKMKSMLHGGGNASSVGVKLKNLGFLRNGLGFYEAFMIEKQSGFYLAYILMEGMTKNHLLQIKDLEKLKAYRNAKLNIIEKNMSQLFEKDNVNSILRNIVNNCEGDKKKELIDALPSKRIQLILIMFYLISAVHSADASLSVAKCVMEEIESIQNFSDAYIEKTLLNIDNMLLEWVKKFNCQYDFLLEIMVYMYSYKKTDERLRCLEEIGEYSGIYFGSKEFMEIDEIMQKVYSEGISAVRQDKRENYEKLKRRFSKESEYTEQKIYNIISNYIIHGSYPLIFDSTK